MKLSYLVLTGLLLPTSDSVFAQQKKKVPPPPPPAIVREPSKPKMPDSIVWVTPPGKPKIKNGKIPPPPPPIPVRRD